MSYEIFVSHFLNDMRAVVTNNCNEDIPLGTLFHAAFWATYLREDEVFRCSVKSPTMNIQLVLASSNVFRRQIDSIPRGYSAAVTFDGSGIQVIRDLLAVKPDGAFVLLRAGHA